MIIIIEVLFLEQKKNIRSGKEYTNGVFNEIRITFSRNDK